MVVAPLRVTQSVQFVCQYRKLVVPYLVHAPFQSVYLNLGTIYYHLMSALKNLSKLLRAQEFRAKIIRWKIKVNGIFWGASMIRISIPNSLYTHTYLLRLVFALSRYAESTIFLTVCKQILSLVRMIICVVRNPQSSQ